MKILILNTDYPGFLQAFYGEHPGLARQSYAEQMRARMETLFGVADFYSRNLRLLGHEAIDIHANNPHMQGAWAREHGLALPAPPAAPPAAGRLLGTARRLAARTPLRHLKAALRPLLPSAPDPAAWMYEILGPQIRHYRPDVLLNQDLSLSAEFLRDHKPHIGLLVGQHASPLPDQDFRVYDLMLSSLPNLVEHFARAGLPAELHRFGFEPAVLPRLAGVARAVPVSFAGSVFSAHASRREWLAAVCREVPVHVWGQGAAEAIPLTASGGSRRGPVWGLEMYRTLAASRITLNHHIDVAGPYANNMRLYEATGAGALLVTDWKANLDTLFEPGKEVVSYRTAGECVELLRHYLAHESERAAIAAAGQARTLREHTYLRRMEELLAILRRYC